MEEVEKRKGREEVGGVGTGRGGISKGERGEKKEQKKGNEEEEEEDKQKEK